MSGNPPANWYADPEGRPQMRYWDGSAWTQQFRDYPQPMPPPPPPLTAEVANSGVAAADQPSPPPVAVGPTPSTPAGPVRRQRKTALYLTVAVAVLASVAVGVVALNRQSRGDGLGGGGGRLPDGLEVSVTAKVGRLSDASQMPPDTHVIFVEVTLRNPQHDTELAYDDILSTLVDAKGHSYGDSWLDSGLVESPEKQQRFDDVSQLVGATYRADGPKTWFDGDGDLGNPLLHPKVRADSTVTIDDVFLVDDSAPRPLRFSLLGQGLEGGEDKTLEFTFG
jgi:hypothetical protein